MRYSVKFFAAFATSATLVAAAALPASAECKSYAFEVNDYGKDGPTKDAKSLLDKMIASKMAEKGVTDFHTGKKTVSCYMFLNFILFDEYTCSAEAKVCWGGTPLPASEEAAATDDSAATTTKASADQSATPKVAKKKKKDAAETAKAGDPTAPVRTPVAAVKDPKPAPVHKAETETKPKKDEASAAADSAEKPASTPSSDSAEKSASTSSEKSSGANAKPVETGSLTDAEKKPAAKPKTEKAPADDAVVAPVKAKTSDDAGYPKPMPPPAQDSSTP